MLTVITLLLLGSLALAGDANSTTTLQGINPVQHSEGRGINPVQHSEGRSGDTTTTNATKPPNPVQHSE